MPPGRDPARMRTAGSFGISQVGPLMKAGRMNGAETLIATAVEEGIEVCFANPGTTELPLVVAMDAVPGLRAVLCLHENVATGAAGGYARMIGKPALCLLHLGPGLQNGLTNLHNARRARSPVVTIIGEHATWHRDADPLLASPIAEMLMALGDEVRTCRSADEIAPAMRWAVSHAGGPGHGRLAHIIVPHDCQLAEAGAELPAAARGTAARIAKGSDVAAIEAAAAALEAGQGALLLGGSVLDASGQRLAAAIAEATGAHLICDTFFARMERGAGLPDVQRLPYFPDSAAELTGSYRAVVIVGTRRPVAFFGYPGQPGHLTGEGQTFVLAGAEERPLDALRRLAEALDVHGITDLHDPPVRPPPRDVGPDAAITPEIYASIAAKLQPHGAIVMDEALTASAAYFEASRNAPRFSHLMLTGGAIGQGPSAATGAAMACPDRKVINLQSDGCGAYSVQALWTQARHQLDVVTVIASNRRYDILNREIARAGMSSTGAAAKSLASLSEPDLDWVKIAEGFGVAGSVATTPLQLEQALEKALASRGPFLIEAVLA